MILFSEKFNLASTKQITEKYLPFIIWPILAILLWKYYRVIDQGGDAWRTGDWLINYNLGFIRRGLIGSLFLFFSDLGFSLKWIVFATQAGLYIAIYYLVLLIYRAKQREFTWFVFLFNPAFILFPIYDFQGGFRKEILMFFPFALLCLSYSKGNLGQFRQITILTLFALAVFSHELNILLAPFFFYAYYLCRQEGLLNNRQFLNNLFIVSMLSLIAAIFAFLFRGTSDLSNAICDSIVKHGFDTSICQGSIYWLSKNSREAFTAHVPYSLASYIKNYGELFFLSIAPLALIVKLGRVKCLVMFIGLVSIFPLYILAVDWGRWIHIYIFFVFLLVITESTVSKIELRKLPVIAVILYVSAYSIPHCCNDNVGHGLTGLLKKINELLHLILLI
jgi:hypothetical protein